MTIDRVSNMLSALKNASMAKKPYIEVIASNELENIAKVLKTKGYLTEVKSFKPKDKSYKMLHLELSKDGKNFMFTEVVRISKPGRRIYKKSSDLGRSKEGFGLFVVSTSRGIMDGDSAKKKKLGGELICEIY
jgi:small subunit ribosomal protein S8